MVETPALATPEVNEEAARREIEQLQNLQRSKEWQLYTALVNQQMSVLANQLIGAVVPNRDYLAGLIKGLDDAIALPKQLVALYDEQKALPDNLAVPSPQLADSPFPEG